MLSSAKEGTRAWVTTRTTLFPPSPPRPASSGSPPPFPRTPSPRAMSAARSPRCSPTRWAPTIACSASSPTRRSTSATCARRSSGSSSTTASPRRTRSTSSTPSTSPRGVAPGARSRRARAARRGPRRLFVSLDRPRDAEPRRAARQPAPGFRDDVRRTPIWGLGCAGGAAGLSRARDFARADPEAACSRRARAVQPHVPARRPRSRATWSPPSLFADGAAAAVVAGAARRRGRRAPRPPLAARARLAQHAVAGHARRDGLGRRRHRAPRRVLARHPEHRARAGAAGARAIPRRTRPGVSDDARPRGRASRRPKVLDAYAEALGAPADGVPPRARRAPRVRQHVVADRACSCSSARSGRRHRRRASARCSRRSAPASRASMVMARGASA